MARPRAVLRALWVGLRATWGLVAAGALLAGCAADTRPSDQYLAVHGYWYHDANHPNGGGGQASQQAINNAVHGTWLWPPATITQMTRIVTYAHRYKRPPRKRKAVALEAPAIVAARHRATSR